MRCGVISSFWPRSTQLATRGAKRCLNAAGVGSPPLGAAGGAAQARREPAAAMTRARPRRASVTAGQVLEHSATLLFRQLLPCLDLPLGPAAAAAEAALLIDLADADTGILRHRADLASTRSAARVRFVAGLFCRGERRLPLLGGVARRDVLRTIPVERLDANQRPPFRRAFAGVEERREIRPAGCLDELHPAEKF